jgi:hypothetical protein
MAMASADRARPQNCVLRRPDTSGDAIRRRFYALSRHIRATPLPNHLAIHFLTTYADTRDAMTAALLDDVESLSERIAELVRQRQELRAAAADPQTLERNRLEIARMQQLLSEALIRQYGSAAA